MIFSEVVHNYIAAFWKNVRKSAVPRPLLILLSLAALEYDAAACKKAGIVRAIS